MSSLHIESQTGSSLQANRNGVGTPFSKTSLNCSSTGNEGSGKVLSVSEDLATVSTAANVRLSSVSLLNENRTPVVRLSSILQELELRREQRWKCNGKAAEVKLHWRAAAIQHMLHIVPGETILELSAGSGMLTEQLDSLLHGENSLTSIVFSQELFAQAAQRCLPGVNLLRGDCLNTVPPAHFDYVIGSGMLWHSGFIECMSWIHSVLKPGGQMFFFEPNFYWPARLFNEMRSRPDEFKDHPLKIRHVLKACADAGFDYINLTPHDIVSCRLGERLMTQLQAKAVLLEHMPVVHCACASMYMLARKRGQRAKPEPNLADQPAFYGTVSVVVPARNEAANIANLIGGLLRSYSAYIHEIVIVNDDSADGTAELVGRLAASDPRVRLINRSKPNGVGMALKDGYRAATGQYILSMDCDFVEILPELRNLFRAVAEGHDGAIGSRFSHESILVNYPFVKLLFNRLCHALVKLFLLSTARDLTNNLKLYRSEILKSLEISSPHFSANLETGLKPLLAGYDIVEVPISWINRTSAMGSSSFYLRKVGMAYARTLLACWRHNNTQAKGLLPIAWRRVLKSVGRASPSLL
jgi:SAM-dependent methyltransferase